MDTYHPNELAATVIDQAHTIRLLNARVAQLEREIVEHAATHAPLASADERTDTPPMETPA